MADPIISGELRARAMLRIAQSGPALARLLDIDPPAPVAGEAAKEPTLREARTLESLADFIDRATAAVRENGEPASIGATAETHSSDEPRRRGRHAKIG